VHEHGHDHHGETCDHGDCAHDHEHEHQHTAAHSHAHDHGHDHGWNPWRYSLLIIPIVLYFLNLPNASMLASGINTSGLDAGVRGKFVENTGMLVLEDKKRGGIEVVSVARDSPAAKAGLQVHDLITEIHEQDGKAKKLVAKDLSIDDGVKALGGVPGTKVRLTLLHENEERQVELTRARDIMNLQFKELEGAAYHSSDREYYEGRTVRIVGLVRYKMTCCAADAIPLNVVIMLDPQCKENITGLSSTMWVEVTGRVQFGKRNGEYVAIVILGSPKDVREVPADNNPYLQTT